MKREWLKEIREKKKMTHEDVSLKSGISRSYYTEIEIGKKRPSVEAAKKISKVLSFKWTLFFDNKSSECAQEVNGN